MSTEKTAPKTEPKFETPRLDPTNPFAAFDPMAGGYPVQPLPGQELPPVPRRRSRAPQLQDALNGADHSEGS